MIAAELLEHLVKKNEEFYGKISGHRFFKDTEEFQDPEYILFQEDFTYTYITNFLKELYAIYYKQKDILQRDLEFFKDPKSKEDFIFSEIQKYKKEYDSNEYNYIFTLHNFHNEFFEIEKVDTLVYNLISIHEEIFELYEEVPKSQIHLDAIDYILEEEFFEMKKIAEILISLKLIHLEQENFQKESTPQIPRLQKKDNSKLTLNQKLLLIDKLVSMNNWTNLTQTRQAELIHLITNQNIDNIIKGLRKLSKKPSEKSTRETDDFENIKSITKDLN